jgi:ATP/maltotriose-dependent transcriptional regulator MalT
VGVIQSALALTQNSLGRRPDAMTAATVASAFPDDLVSSCWGLIELIEAAARAGDRDRARTALQTLSVMTTASGTGWALGIEARCRALLACGVEAEQLYREAIDRLAGTRIRTELARTQLLYGVWLRRQQRRHDARAHLRIAHDMFTAMGAEVWAGCAAQQLRSAGDSVRRRSTEASADLTTHEAQIVRLACDGLSNLEIGARLFLSPRTVEWHLGNVFAKLGITSRRELNRALARPGRLSA